MKQSILSRGAEAILSKKGNGVIKTRVQKGYRLPLIDTRIRTQRTRKEAKLLDKAASVIPTPAVLSVSEKTNEITMKYIPGKKLSDHLDGLRNRLNLCKKIGVQIARLHNNNIIHGDLTTSNMILHENTVYFIDFGLGFHSTRIEDKAVDLHLMKQALESRHSLICEPCFSAILNGYKKASNDTTRILNRFARVETRGRYKRQH